MMMQAQQIHISQGVMSVQMGGKSVLHAALHRGVRSVDGGKAATYGGCIKKRKNGTGCIKKRKNGTDVLNIFCRKC